MQAKTTKLTTPIVQIPYSFLKNTLALAGGALATFPFKSGPQFFLRPVGGARASSVLELRNELVNLKKLTLLKILT